MIVYFPNIYHDELVYSWLSRFYIKSGYLSYMFFSQEIYVRKYQKPSIEFINEMNPEIMDVISRYITFEDLIKNHTMFPYYTRFIEPNKRALVFDKLTKMDVSGSDMSIGLPKNKNRLNRFIRYCPMCVKEDRDQYGETYWHRTHQIAGITVCPKHTSLLLNSNVIMNRNNTTILHAAENSNINDEHILISTNTFENQLSQYLEEVFFSEINMKANAGTFIGKVIQKTKYIKGVNRDLELLREDFSNWYRRPDNCFTENWQIEKILTNDRFNFEEICLLSMFLKIPAKDLACL